MVKKAGDHKLTKNTEPDNTWTTRWHKHETGSTQYCYYIHLQPAIQHGKNI